jgi:competence protein ComEA
MIRTTAFFLLAAGSFALFSGAQSLPAESGKATFLRVCSGCHETDVATGSRHSRQEWDSLVSQMVSMGAPATDAEMDQIVDYLTTNFGPAPAKAKVNVNTANAKDLTDGLGLSAAESDAIVAFRAKNGNFATVDDLKKVQGVDAAKIEAARNVISF